MKKSVLIVAALGALALAGCAHNERYADNCRQVSCVKPLEVRTNPQVTVKGGQVLVSPEVLYFLPNEKNVVVTWRLPMPSKLSFPGNGIVIEGEIIDQVIRGSKETKVPDSVVLNSNQNEIINCARSKDGLEFTCLNRNTRPGVYKYTVRVRDGDKTLERDPPFVNM